MIELRRSVITRCVCLYCSEVNGKHTSAVWQLRWVEKEQGADDEHSEVLVSVSTDGRVTQWAIRKGFESTGQPHTHTPTNSIKSF